MSTEDDLDDPDYIAATPPLRVDDPRDHFQKGAHEGLWMEFDERGVPMRNIKKKKPAKKERDDLEQEYLNAKKGHLTFLKDIELWEQKKVDAEAALEKRDKFRWAFRRIGDQMNDPLHVEELEDFLRIMEWDKLNDKEMKAVLKNADRATNSEGRLELGPLRNFAKEQIPALVLEERLGKIDSNAVLQVAKIYSPRSWRKQLEGAQMSPRSRASHARGKTKGDSSSKKDPKKSPKTSPRKDGTSSPRGKDKDGGSSPAGKSRDKDGGSSPRGKSRRDK